MITAQPTGTDRVLARQGSLASRLRIGESVPFVLLVVMPLVFVVPIFWMRVTSLKEMSELYSTPTLWFGHGLAWHNSRDIFDYVPFALYFRNTAIIVVAAAIGGIASSALVAYSFAWM